MKIFMITLVIKFIFLSDILELFLFVHNDHYYFYSTLYST